MARLIIWRINSLTRKCYTLKLSIFWRYQLRVVELTSSSPSEDCLRGLFGWFFFSLSRSSSPLSYSYKLGIYIEARKCCKSHRKGWIKGVEWRAEGERLGHFERWLLFPGYLRWLIGLSFRAESVNFHAIKVDQFNEQKNSCNAYLGRVINETRGLRGSRSRLLVWYRRENNKRPGYLWARDGKIRGKIAIL